MQVSVIVPTFNRIAIVARTLETLFRQDFPVHEFEIIVVVDGSTDGTAAMLRTLAPKCALRILDQENRGPAGARNSGLRAAQGDLVIFLDDDMLCEPTLVRAHVEANATAPQSIGVGAFFISKASPRTLATDTFDLELGAFHLSHQSEPGVTIPADGYCFANTSARRSIIESVGGFDELFRMKEDEELAYRLTSAGFEFRYVPTAVAYQHYDKSAFRLLRDAAAFGVGDAHMLRKHPEFFPQSELCRVMSQAPWKRRLRMTLARIPILPDAFFCAVWWTTGFLGKAIPSLHRFAVRVLQLHRGVVWLRTVLRDEHSSTSSLLGLAKKRSQS